MDYEMEHQPTAIALVKKKLNQLASKIYPIKWCRLCEQQPLKSRSQIAGK